MSLFISSLNSGSNGNCYYIGTASEAVLVDAGISCRETERRMRRIGLTMQKVKAIFISHEHSDHIRGVEVLQKKYELPVYISKGTHRTSRLALNKKLTHYFSRSETIEIGALTVTAFPKFHDASEPCSFLVEGNGVRTGVFTDIGEPCEHVVRHFKKCHAAFLEANYDEQMLERGRYPFFLKQRIRGDKGHLSNDQALKLFTSHRPAYMSHLLLSHLSKENNKPALVQELFTRHAGKTNIIVASRYKETPVYHIRKGEFGISGLSVKQISLFD